MKAPCRWAVRRMGDSMTAPNEMGHKKAGLHGRRLMTVEGTIAAACVDCLQLTRGPQACLGRADGSESTAGNLSRAIAHWCTAACYSCPAVAYDSVLVGTRSSPQTRAPSRNSVARQPARLAIAIGKLAVVRRKTDVAFADKRCAHGDSLGMVTVDVAWLWVRRR